MGCACKNGGAKISPVKQVTKNAKKNPSFRRIIKNQQVKYNRNPLADY